MDGPQIEFSVGCFTILGGDGLKKRQKKDLIKLIGIAVFIAVGILSAFYANEESLSPAPSDNISENHFVDFIDCGQGDSTLLVSDGVATLVDATTGEEAEKVLDHLKKRGIQKIDHFVLTHPHEDHIGGAEEVLKKFQVENIYMKRPTVGTEPTTSVYLNLLKEIKRQGKKVHAVQPDDQFQCGKFEMCFLGPVEEYKDLNDQSLVLQARYGEVSFLITGDQETPAENDLVARRGLALKSTVLKVGHHGSSTSSGKTFLKAVAPQYAVISCGKGNTYGHPHRSLISRLEDQNIVYYRTDTQGTITFYTDGVHLKEETS